MKAGSIQRRKMEEIQEQYIYTYILLLLPASYNAYFDYAVQECNSPHFHTWLNFCPSISTIFACIISIVHYNGYPIQTFSAIQSFLSQFLLCYRTTANTFFWTGYLEKLSQGRILCSVANKLLRHHLLINSWMDDLPELSKYVQCQY